MLVMRGGRYVRRPVRLAPVPVAEDNCGPGWSFGGLCCIGCSFCFSSALDDRCGIAIGAQRSRRVSRSASFCALRASLCSGAYAAHPAIRCLLFLEVRFSSGPLASLPSAPRYCPPDLAKRPCPASRQASRIVCFFRLCALSLDLLELLPAAYEEVFSFACLGFQKSADFDLCPFTCSVSNFRPPASDSQAGRRPPDIEHRGPCFVAQFRPVPLFPAFLLSLSIMGPNCPARMPDRDVCCRQSRGLSSCKGLQVLVRRRGDRFLADRQPTPGRDRGARRSPRRQGARRWPSSPFRPPRARM